MPNQEETSTLQRGCRKAAKGVAGIWDDLQKNNLWRRILKNVLATIILVSVVLIPGTKNAIGKAAYLGAIATVFGHPGRRFGQLVEALILILSGTALGVAWSILGIYLSSMVIFELPSAAYAIRGIFLAIATLIHGFLRSRTPRLFIFVLLMIIVSIVTLTSTATTVTAQLATQILYPILIAAGCSVFVNVCFFPEFSSRYLGQMTIDILNDTAAALDDAGQYFVEAQFNNLQAGKTVHDKTEISQSSLETDSTGLTFLIKAKKSFLRYFSYGTSNNEGLSGHRKPSLATLTSSKAKIRKKLNDCKSAQQECNFELALSVLPPRDIKPISVAAMKRFVANTIAVISACESKFALLGNEDEADNPDQQATTTPAVRIDNDNETSSSDVATGITTSFQSSSRQYEDRAAQRESNPVADQDKTELDFLKPKREIEFGDARMLRYLLRRAAKPYEDIHRVSAKMIEIIIACIAFAYDVSTLPSGANVPKGILVEELDVHVSSLQQALLQFDIDAASALEGAASLREAEGLDFDVMPREEVFLMSSFMLNVRQAVAHLEVMLRHSRELVDRHNQRHGRRRIYAPHIRWVKWLYSGAAEDEAMPTYARKANREGGLNADDVDDDDEASDSVGSKQRLIKNRNGEDVEHSAQLHLPDRKPRKAKVQKSKMSASQTIATSKRPTFSLRLRGQAADSLEWMQDSEDVLYAMKLTVALFLVLWPAFVSSWNAWFSFNRGLWAALQLVLITEVSIGTSVMTFVLRAIGTTLGCLWGYIAIEARGGNRFVCAIIILIGLFPCAYVQLGTKYPKAGMVAIVSICVVALSFELQTVPGTATETYLKRWIAFIIGGCVALLVEVALLPVKARTRLVESLATTIRQINDMEKCIAYGIESGKKIDIQSPSNLSRFDRAGIKANNALTAGETFLPFCSHEPRIKGSFEGLGLIYGEIIFVLHQIVDRMDNMLQLRTAYGSGPLEDLNTEIYPYRRNVAGSITITLFAIHAALTTKLPLPQYLPSARLAHLRMINRVREVVLQQVSSGQDDQDVIAKLARQQAVRRKYLSWNAASAAQAEIIEFLEELVELSKLLVGVNEFRSGLLTRGTLADYVDNTNMRDGQREAIIGDEAPDVSKDQPADTIGAFIRSRTTTLTSKDQPPTSQNLTRRRRGTTLTSTDSNGEEVPASLLRIQSRKMEAGMRRQRTNESANAQRQQRQSQQQG